jgi:hypothetical protein
MTAITGLRALLVPLALLLSGGLAAAADLDGNWAGTADAIYPDGTVVAGINFDGTVNQDPSWNGLFQGSFTFTIPSVGATTGLVTGFIGADGKFSGLLSVILSAGDPPVAVAVVEGKLSGNRITATTRDFSDGTTSVLWAFRVR